MPAWLWPVASLVGSAVTGFLGSRGQQQTNQANLNIAREQMAFQREMAANAEAFSERMSSTAVQRSVADYQAAGLNPALAYDRSSSSPTGVTAGGASATMQNPMQQLPNLVSSALSTLQAVEALRQMEAQTKSIKADIQNKQIDAANKLAEGEILTARARTATATQPFEVRLRELEKIFKELDLTGLQNRQALEAWLQHMGGFGGASNAAGMAKFAARLLQLIR